MVNPPADIQSLSQVLGETNGSQNLTLESEKDKKLPESMKLFADNMDHRLISSTTSSTGGILTNSPVLEKNVASLSSQGCLTSEDSPRTNICGAHDPSIVVPSNIKGALNADSKAKTSVWPSQKILHSKVEAEYDMQGQEMLSSSTMRAETILKEKTEHLTTKRQYYSTRKCDNAPPKLRRHNVTVQAGQSPVDSSRNLKGTSAIEHKQLVAVANLVHVAKRVAADGLLWSEMENFFASVSAEDLDFLTKQLQGLKEIEGDGKKHENDKAQVSVDSDPLFQGAQSLSRFDRVPSLAQRVLSAVIDEDVVEDLYNQNEGSISFQCTNDSPDHGSLDVMANDPNNCNRVLTEVELGDLQAPDNCLLDEVSCNRNIASHTQSNQCELSSSHCKSSTNGCLSFPARGDFPVISKEDSGSKFSLKLGTSDISSCSSQYQMLPLDDKILMELQSIGIPLDSNSMPCPPLEEKSVDQEIMDLKVELEKQGIKKTKILSQIDEAIQRESEVEKKKVEQLAMDLLLTMAYKKHMANGGGNSSRKAANKVEEEKAEALAFGNRILDKYKEYESTGKSCFSEPRLKEILFSAPCEKDMKSAVSKFQRNFSGGCRKKATRKSYSRFQAKNTASSSRVQTGDSSVPKACSSVESLNDDSSSSSSSSGRVKRKRSLSELCAPKETGTVKRNRSASRKGVNRSTPTSSTTGSGIILSSAECSPKNSSLENEADQELYHLLASESELYEVPITFDPALENLSKTFSVFAIKKAPSDAAEFRINRNQVGEADVLTLLNTDEGNMTESEYSGLAVPTDDLWDVPFLGY